MVYDVRCMMYDVWCMMYDVWCVMYDDQDCWQSVVCSGTDYIMAMSDGEMT